jgi:hypothetical protein
MKAFLVKLKNGYLLDAVICAADEDDAKLLVAEEVDIIREIPANVASVMGAPEERGRHDDVLSRWGRGPTTITGELIKR